MSARYEFTAGYLFCGSGLEALARSAAGEVWRLCGGGQWVAPAEIGEAA